MPTTLSTILLDAPRAAAVWLILLAVAVVAVAAFWPSRRTATADAALSTLNLDEIADKLDEGADTPAAEARRYAEEIAVAAYRAEGTALRRYAEWEKSHDAVAVAWEAFDRVDGAVRRLAAAAALPAPHTPHTPAEYADRERYLHRAATAAYRRGELSAADLAEVYAHSNGWNPRLHPVQQELVLQRFIREHLLHNYRQASAAERAAWHAAELADAAMLSLRAEAALAAQRAEAAEAASGSVWLDEQLRRDAPSTVHIRRPAWTPAARKGTLLSENA